MVSFNNFCKFYVLNFIRKEHRSIFKSNDGGWNAVSNYSKFRDGGFMNSIKFISFLINYDRIILLYNHKFLSIQAR